MTQQIRSAVSLRLPARVRRLCAGLPGDTCRSGAPESFADRPSSCFSILLYESACLAILAGCFFLVLAPRPAQAYDYGRPIENIRSEEDIYELNQQGELTDEETERLISMFQQKLNLNRATVAELYGLPDVTLELADAIVGYRHEVGRLTVLSDLGKVPGMTDGILAQMEPFVMIRAPLEIPVDGTVRTRMTWESSTEPLTLETTSSGSSYYAKDVGLNRLPEAYVQVKANTQDKIFAGVVASFGEGLAAATYNSDYMGFVGEWGKPLIRLRKAYVLYDEGDWSAVLGSYSVGFGLHLVFDETRQYQPDGFYGDDEVYGTTSMSYPQRMLGAAGTYRAVELGPFNLEVTGFYSRRPYDAYQYDIVLDTEGVDDELSNTVYVCPWKEGCDTWSDMRRIYPLTLPRVYQEQIFGGHVALKQDRLTYLGLTAYFSGLYPNGTDEFEFGLKDAGPDGRERFGAVGADFGFSRGPVVLAGEYALMPHNLSQAAYIRGVVNLGAGEFVASIRHYDTDFDNPHGRGTADADTYNGDRARDETGAYLQATFEPYSWLKARAAYDIWYRKSLFRWRHQLNGRLEVTPVKRFKASLVGTFKDKQLGLGGRQFHYSGSETSSSIATVDDEYDDAEETDVTSDKEAAGSRGTAAIQLQGDVLSSLRIYAYYKRAYEDAAYRYYDQYCSDANFAWLVGQTFWFKARYSPFSRAYLTARFRFDDEDVYGTKGQRLAEVYLDWAQSIGQRVKLGVRYTLEVELKDKELEITTFCETLPDGSCGGGASEAGTDELMEPVHALRGILQVAF